MGYVFDFQDARAYEKWFFSPENRCAAELEQQLVFQMLKPVRGRRLLDIGCGTGARLNEFLEGGLDVSGLDPSPYMLDMAREKFQHRVAFYRESGESLPFDDNTFHYTTLITVLEYVDDPGKVIAEACRVTREKIFVGLQNRHAVKTLQRRIRARFSDVFYKNARFYSIWEVKRITQKVVGNVPMTWKTVCRPPGYFEKYGFMTMDRYILRKMPFGAFAGILIQPVPKFWTIPMPLKYEAKHSIAPGV